jgi:PUA domain protein
MRYLSNKEKKEIQDMLPAGYEITKKDEIKEGNDNILYKNSEKFLIKIDNELLPYLKSINEEEYKSVYVDKGAIPFVIKGADLMRPGIQKIDSDIKENQIILIKDENHNKTIAIGKSIYSSEDLENQEKGKSVKIFHYVGDEYY